MVLSGAPRERRIERDEPAWLSRRRVCDRPLLGRADRVACDGIEDGSEPRSGQKLGRPHALVAAIVCFAHARLLRIVAEGIETEAQLQQMRDPKATVRTATISVIPS